MGTRADFWKTRDSVDGWLGSIAWDGYPEGVPERVLGAKSLHEFEALVEDVLATDDSASRPSDGWPWPWENSHLTDFSYVWNEEEGRVEVFNYGRPGADPEENATKADFPDMTKVQRTTLGKRSGLITFGVKG